MLPGSRLQALTPGAFDRPMPGVVALAVVGPVPCVVRRHRAVSPRLHALALLRGQLAQIHAGLVGQRLPGGLLGRPGGGAASASVVATARRHSLTSALICSTDCPCRARYGGTWTTHPASSNAMAATVEPRIIACQPRRPAPACATVGAGSAHNRPAARGTPPSLQGHAP